MNFTRNTRFEAGGDIARQTELNITAGSEVSPVRDGDGNDCQDKAEDAEEHHSSAQCRLPLPARGPAVGRPRGSWSAHPGDVGSGGGGGGGGDGGVFHSHILPLLHAAGCFLSLWDRSRSENCYQVTV